MQNIIPGLTYRFRVKARNVVGFSSLSSELAIIAAVVPGAPLTVTTQNSGQVVIIRWNPPST